MRRSLTRREFRETAVGTAAVSAVGHASQPSRPNVLFILADDLGYGDLSCYGRPDYQTPSLDGLAEEGIGFMSAYAAAPPAGGVVGVHRGGNIRHHPLLLTPAR